MSSPDAGIDDAKCWDNAKCWQCGAPADPDCLYIRRLSRPKRPAPDGRGFRTTHGWASDTVHVPVPRCARCQSRNWITATLVGGGFMIGGVIGGTGYPSNGWTTIVGGFGTVITLLVAVRLHDRRFGFRSVDSYPPIRRLLEDGWSEPV